MTKMIEKIQKNKRILRKNKFFLVGAENFKSRMSSF